MKKLKFTLFVVLAIISFSFALALFGDFMKYAFDRNIPGNIWKTFLYWAGMGLSVSIGMFSFIKTQD